LGKTCTITNCLIIQIKVARGQEGKIVIAL